MLLPSMSVTHGMLAVTPHPHANSKYNTGSKTIRKSARCAALVPVATAWQAGPAAATTRCTPTHDPKYRHQQRAIAADVKRLRMPSEISYALVACGNVVLAEESAVSGNANLVARKIAEKVPPGNTRVSYAQEGQLFHVLVAEGITFLCMADEALGRRLPYAFLEDVRQRFLGEHGSDAHSAEAFSLNDAFAPVLAQRMDFFSHDPSADAINRTRNAVADVKNIMVENIEKVLERGERIELLVHKTDALQGQAFSFRRETRRLKNQMWWQKVKLTVTIVAVLLIIMYAIIAFTCSPTFHC